MDYKHKMDLLVFYPQGAYLYIEFMGKKYIEHQPTTPDEVLVFMESIQSIIRQLDTYVEANNLKEIIELNLQGVPLSKLNSETALHLIDLVASLRKDKKVVEKIRITNSNPIFKMIYAAVKSRLPKETRDLIEVVSNSTFF